LIKAIDCLLTLFILISNKINSLEIDLNALKGYYKITTPDGKMFIFDYNEIIIEAKI